MKVYAITETCTDVENKLVVTKGERKGGEGPTRGMGLTDTNYYI